ncbi:MAG: deaminase [Vampirovibrionales bacterium]
MPIQWHTPRTLPPQWLAGQPVSQAQHDAFWMERCLQLAQRGAEGASPNPLVGCVIVAGSGPFEGRVIGEGFHAQAGQAHAEVDALRQAQEAIAAGYFPASVLQGATLYVNLEPCCHTVQTGPY